MRPMSISNTLLCFSFDKKAVLLFIVLPPFYLEVMDGNHLVLIVTPSASHDHFFVPFGFASPVKLVVGRAEEKHP